MKRALLRSLVIAAAIVTGWSILGAFFASQDLSLASASGASPAMLEEVAIVTALSVTVWTLLTPFVLFLAQLPALAKLRVSTALRFAAIILLFALLRSLAASLFMPYLNQRPLTLADVRGLIAIQFHSNAVMVALLVLLRFFYDSARTMRERERRALTLEAQLARAQLEQLRGQLQPHFLFNAINGIAALVHTDPHRADEMLMELASLLRSTLDLGRTDTIPLHRELELVEHYLRIQTMRFADRLQVRRRIDRRALPCEVPALLLQPLLENSLRHVIAQRPAGGLVEVSARREADRLLLRVEDDGPGFDPATSKLGVGLTNTIARLEQLYRGDARIDFTHGNGMFAVTIDIPAREAA